MLRNACSSVQRTDAFQPKLRTVWLTVLLGAVNPNALCAQSAHLAALEGSTPSVEPTAGVPSGLANLFRDPTLSPRSSGALISVYRTRAAGVGAFHGITAFRWGPRWSLTFASTEIGQLFDTVLTNQDPALTGLRARALIGALDATVSRQLGSVSVGLAVAGDEMIGDIRGSTLMRIHARMLPLRTNRLSLGVHWSGVVGGSLPHAAGGRRQADVVFTQDFGSLRASAAFAFYRGAHWRYSETIGGYAVSTRFEAFSTVHFDLGAGRYRASYGAESREWECSAGGGLIIRNLTFDIRYTRAVFGLGSGYGITLGYEP